MERVIELANWKMPGWGAPELYLEERLNKKNFSILNYNEVKTLIDLYKSSYGEIDIELKEDESYGVHFKSHSSNTYSTLIYSKNYPIKSELDLEIKIEKSRTFSLRAFYCEVIIFKLQKGEI